MVEDVEKKPPGGGEMFCSWELIDVQLSNAEYQCPHVVAAEN